MQTACEDRRQIRASKTRCTVDADQVRFVLVRPVIALTMCCRSRSAKNRNLFFQSDRPANVVRRSPFQ